ncbi:MAG TPA: adenylate/guanylate cyclase domain-containing protein, partial [Ramlibacter sp.]|nr:adenylate/guanylate cyclase domain-containing protein [Ramlibacter sp.]
VWAVSLSQVGSLAEAKVFDLFTALAAPRAGDPRIVILAIDEPSFQELQMQWPFPRSLHARLLQRLHADGAAAVGFDVIFAEPSNDADDNAFAGAIAAARPVVLAASQELLETGNAAMWTTVQPIAPLLAAGAIRGDTGVHPDDDYVVRRQPGGAQTLSAQLARLGRTPTTGGEPAGDLIEYLGPRGTIDTRSYYQAVLPGLLPPGFFRGKIVLVGHTTRSAAELRSTRTDSFNSPFATADGGDRLFPGVEIHATLLANRLSGGGLRTVSSGWVVALIAVLGTLLATSGSRTHPGLAAGIAVALAAGVTALSWGLFSLQKLWLPPVFPVAALLSLSGATGLLNYLAVRRRGVHVRRMFSQYVPPEVVARLVEQPDLMRLGGEAREVTLMFTDLSGFTAMSERLSAEQTVEVLSAYFDAMTPIVHRYQGTVDKFIGDAIMAFWGAPLADAAHAEHAVRAAIEMQAAMPALLRQLGSRGLPPIAMRIGVHTGRAVIGNVGSSTRFSYTAVGDAVNLAARLEGANKAFGTDILVSQSTASRLPADLPLRPLDDVVVKGRTESVRVFTPCREAQLCELSAAALSAFRDRRWDESESQLRALLRLRPADPTALRLLERIAKARGLPPGAPWRAAEELDKL